MSLHAPRIALVLALALATGALGVPSITLAGAPVPPPMLSEPPASEAEPAPLRAGLRVDASALGGEGGPISNKVEEQARAVFQDKGYQEPLDDADPRIVIVVEKAPDKSNPGYVIGFSVERGEDVLPGSARQSDCSLCTNTELIERIGQELPKLLEIAGANQAVREVAVGDGDGEPGDGDGEATDPEPPVKPIGPLGFAGIGLSVVGLAGVGTGVALAVKGFEPLADDPGMRRNYRTPGNVILAVGGAALIAGVVMIAVDVSKRKKANRARQQQSSTVRWTGLGLAF